MTKHIITIGDALRLERPMLKTEAEAVLVQIRDTLDLLERLDPAAIMRSGDTVATTTAKLQALRRRAMNIMRTPPGRQAHT